MARPSVIPELLSRLTSYLSAIEVRYLGQSDELRQPTLPYTPDRKVNVRAIAQGLGLRLTQEKYLYEREELSAPINQMAEQQGLLPIGSRLGLDARFTPLKQRIEQQAHAAQSAVQAAIEAQAVQAELLEQLASAATEIENLRVENAKLRAQLDAVHAGIFVRIEP